MAASGRGTAQASWLELFFDLVAVAGVALIAHLLHGAPDLADVGLYALLFLAFWTAWVCFTLYAYVADEDTRARTVLAAMFGMAVMAAAVPGVHEGDDQQARVFALAYILTRGLANRAWQHRRQILVDRPAAQMSLGVIPWIVSICAHIPSGTGSGRWVSPSTCTSPSWSPHAASSSARRPAGGATTGTPGRARSASACRRASSAASRRPHVPSGPFLMPAIVGGRCCRARHSTRAWPNGALRKEIDGSSVSRSTTTLPVLGVAGPSFT
ncbi:MULTISPECIES: low temperature requirement protein A [unclassified Streptomyces]|uniref:low temperature requirement protein A n=1 Tax=unclassified Streptomyces TaxID=2593676 RepID=UPI00224D2D53|nr:MULTISPECIES: low temperature requirement protein A [unclassified Streptomyces]MCX5052395.1 low temperature requirement protein A [Streptomyces sp. NBC_00474]